MATTDFSRVSDEVLEDVFNRLFDNPNLIPNEAERRAWVAERNRRAAGGTRAPDNVEANLAAAAAPLEVDPTPSAAKPVATADAYSERLLQAGYAPDETDAIVRQEAGMPGAYQLQESPESLRASAEQHRARVARQDAFDASLAEAYGHNAPPPVSNPDTVMVDGVRVPTHRLSDGQSFGGMYTLRALREAKDAAEEERLATMFDQSAKEDIAKYGTRAFFRYKRDANGEMIPKPGGGFEVEEIPTTELVGPDGRPDPALAAQQENVRARRDMLNRQASQNRALRDRTGLKEYRARQEAIRDRLRLRNWLAGGSNKINTSNIGMFNQLAGMPPEAQIRQLQYALPGGGLMAQVDAQNAATAGRMAQAAVTALLANNPNLTPEQRQLQELMLQAKEEELPPAAAAARERARAGRVAGVSPAGQRLLSDIESRRVGNWATAAEVDAAIAEAVAAGVPQQDAERYFSRRRSWGNWWGGGEALE